MRYNRENVLGNLYRRAKGVIIGKASSRVLTFSLGFCPGSQFAYIVFITSCTVHSLWIYNAFFQNFGWWESSSNGLKEWTKCGRKHEPKKLKLSSFSSACFMTSGLCLTCVPVSQNDLSCKFQRSSLQEACQGVPCCVLLAGGMTTLTHILKRRQENCKFIWRPKNLRFVITQVTSVYINRQCSPF